jgi:crossover junction endodeoxyribonuclease RuvC
MKIVAFDPGKIASYAIFDTCTPHLIEIGEIDLIGAGRLIRPCGMHIAEVLTGADCGLVEEVGAMKGQGVSSVFTFGLCAGAILNAISASSAQVETVTPPVWKRSTKITAKTDEGVKMQARAYATQLFPQHKKVLAVKKNHGQAEACLMARWYFLKGPGRDAADDDTKSVLSAEMPDLPEEIIKDVKD